MKKHPEDPRIPKLRKQPIPYEPPMLPFVPECDDQLPVFSRVGRGLAGNTVSADMYVDDNGHTHIHLVVTDGETGETLDEYDKIVDGGVMRYAYNLHPWNNPQTFTITFLYEHQDPEHSWSWTTPEIPYKWDVDPNTGEPTADGIVGSGVASVFLRPVGGTWTLIDIPTSHTIAEAAGRQEKLLYPNGFDRYDFNAPSPGDPWTVNLTYGINGDIDVPSRNDLAKIIGVTPESLGDLAAEELLPAETFGDGINVKEYIDGEIIAALEDIPDIYFPLPIAYGGTGSNGTYGDGYTDGDVVIYHIDNNETPGDTSDDTDYFETISYQQLAENLKEYIVDVEFVEHPVSIEDYYTDVQSDAKYDGDDFPGSVTGQILFTRYGRVCNISVVFELRPDTTFNWTPDKRYVLLPHYSEDYPYYPEEGWTAIGGADHIQSPMHCRKNKTQIIIPGDSSTYSVIDGIVLDANWWGEDPGESIWIGNELGETITLEATGANGFPYYTIEGSITYMQGEHNNNNRQMLRFNIEDIPDNFKKEVSELKKSLGGNDVQRA